MTLSKNKGDRLRKYRKSKTQLWLCTNHRM